MLWVKMEGMESESLDLAFARRTSPSRRREIRDGAGLSRAVLARDLGCTEYAVLAWENGERRPGARLGAAYGRLLRQLIELAQSAE